MMGEKRAVALNSFLNFNERNRAMQQLRNFRFIFISPEMLAVNIVLEKLQEVEHLLVCH